MIYFTINELILVLIYFLWFTVLLIFLEATEYKKSSAHERKQMKTKRSITTFLFLSWMSKNVYETEIIIKHDQKVNVSFLPSQQQSYHGKFSLATSNFRTIFTKTYDENFSLFLSIAPCEKKLELFFVAKIIILKNAVRNVLDIYASFAYSKIMKMLSTIQYLKTKMNDNRYKFSTCVSNVLKIYNKIPYRPCHRMNLLKCAIFRSISL